jgi:Histidine kinase-, DNA gyrase B-, and HSP90-like ATPase
MRDKAKAIAGEIHGKFPEYTVHDITHLDALWDIADAIAGPIVELNAAEGFVLGGAMLVHDLAMGAAAYEDGLAFRDSVEYKDILATIARRKADGVALLPGDLEEADKVYLRETHAIKAELLPTQGWTPGKGVRYYLIDNEELRDFYGDLIGKIAASHWWPFSRARDEFREGLGSLGTLPAAWTVDAVKVAALLRTADAAHLDTRRAPLFLRALRDIKGESAVHWDFQGRFARPRIEGDRLQYSSTRSFRVDEAESWWLAFDSVSAVARELRAVDDAFTVLKRPKFAAKGVLGGDEARSFSEYVKVDGWFPIDARPNIRDIPGLIDRLGGNALYGTDQPGVIAVRELLQNAVDASKALAILLPQDPPTKITFHVDEADNSYNIKLTDFGVGMSEEAIVDGLLDFGTSYWSSPAIRQQLPGLLAGQFRPSGKFGIGFFSVFMLTSRVLVRTLRYKAGPAETIVVEFTDGLRRRPIVRKALESEYLWHSGTIVELRDCPKDISQFSIQNVYRSKKRPKTDVVREFADLLEYCAPFSGFDYLVTVGKTAARVTGVDPLTAPPLDVLKRGRGPRTYFGYRTYGTLYPNLLSEVRDEVKGVFGRAACALSGQFGYKGQGALISRNGVRIADLAHVQGFFYGTPSAAARDSGKADVPLEVLANWAAGQVGKVESGRFSDEERLQCAEWAMSVGANVTSLPVARHRGSVLDRYSLRLWAAAHDVIVIIDPFYDDEGEYFEDVSLDEEVIVTSKFASLGGELTLGTPLHRFIRSAATSTEGSALEATIDAIALGWGLSRSRLRRFSLCTDKGSDESYTAFVGSYIHSGTRARRRVIDAFARKSADVDSLDLMKVIDR